MKLKSKIIAMMIAALSFVNAHSAETGSKAPGDRVQSDGKSITVLASAGAESQPDLAVITLHFTSFGWTVDKSRKKVDGLIKRFTEKLAEKGVTPALLRISDVKLKPSYQFNRDLKTNVPADFLVSRKVTLQLENLADVEKALDSSLSVGSFLLESVILTMKDKKDLERKAFAAALKDGKQKAGEIAKTLESSIGQVVSIVELDQRLIEMSVLQDNSFSLSAADQMAKSDQSVEAKAGADEKLPTVMSGEGFLGLEKDSNAAGPETKDSVQATSKLQITFTLK